jgi:hypothetical protein
MEGKLSGRPKKQGADKPSCSAAHGKLFICGIAIDFSGKLE